MKLFIEPEITVKKFTMEDVITTSSGNDVSDGGGDGNVGGEIWD